MVKIMTPLFSLIFHLVSLKLDRKYGSLLQEIIPPKPELFEGIFYILKLKKEPCDDFGLFATLSTPKRSLRVR